MDRIKARLAGYRSSSLPLPEPRRGPNSQVSSLESNSDINSERASISSRNSSRFGPIGSVPVRASKLSLCNRSSPSPPPSCASRSAFRFETGEDHCPSHNEHAAGPYQQYPEPETPPSYYHNAPAHHVPPHAYIYDQSHHFQPNIFHQQYDPCAYIPTHPVPFYKQPATYLPAAMHPLTPIVPCCQQCYAAAANYHHQLHQRQQPKAYVNIVPPAQHQHILRNKLVHVKQRDTHSTLRDPIASAGRFQGPVYDDDTALWVGNLPDRVSDAELRAFFDECNVLSIRNIQETHCAFLNFATYNEVLDAADRYQLADFRGRAIECNPRKNHRRRPRGSSGDQRPSPPSSATGSTTNSTTAKASTTPATDDPNFSSSSPPSSGSSPDTTSTNHNNNDVQSSSESMIRSTDRHGKDRFFIIKCIGSHNLELARKTNLWATQPQNEIVLNDAYKNCANVYLIFGENKSGKFYGCARMAGPIITPQDNADTSIVNKTAWMLPPPETAPSAAAAARPPQWGNDFPISWLTTAELPFIKINSLRNPWNRGKPVKQARDGVEVYPKTGHALLAAFARNDREEEC
ncbi:hypothetical protein HDU88_001173 [Geranomyces variabilis]|nr:hypothetical protein HDU88_001173 [Geranomyces variabilis]